MNKKILILPILLLLFSCGETPSDSEITITIDTQTTTQITSQTLNITTYEQFTDYLYSVVMCTQYSKDYYGINNLETKIFETEESLNQLNPLIDDAIEDASYVFLKR